MRILIEIRTCLFMILLVSVATFPFATVAQSGANEYIRKNTEISYETIKSLLISDVHLSFKNEVEETSNDETILIAPCSGGDYYQGYADDTNDTLSANLVRLAVSYIYAETALRASKFPEKLWRNLLEETEQKVVRKMRVAGNRTVDDRLNFVAKSLNTSATKQKLKLPKITAYPECSVDFQRFALKLEPAQSRVRFIQKIFYRFCEHIKVDPLDRKHCDYWLAPAKTGDRIFLAGTYFYTIETSSGVTQVEEIDADRLYVDETAAWVPPENDTVADESKLMELPR